MKATDREIDYYTHLALSVMLAIYEKGWGKNYPHEIAEIMQKILDLDRKAFKELGEDGEQDG